MFTLFSYLNLNVSLSNSCIYKYLQNGLTFIIITANMLTLDQYHFYYYCSIILINRTIILSILKSDVQHWSTFI